MTVQPAKKSKHYTFIRNPESIILCDINSLIGWQYLAKKKKIQDRNNFDVTLIHALNLQPC